MTDYYKLLGVPPGADAEAIRTAFRNRAKALHPDAHPHLSGVERERQNERFVQLAQAFDTLRDPARRAAYDRSWRLRHGPAAESARRGRPGGAGFRVRQPGTRTPPPPEPDLEELLQDMEQLLRRFGLDLRQPFERILDALVEWAKAVFHGAVDAWDEGAPGGSGRPAASGSAPERGAERQRQAASGVRPGPSEPEGARGTAAGPAEPGPRARPATQAELESELARLKAEVAAGRRPRHTDEDAELRRIKERLRRAHRHP